MIAELTLEGALLAATAALATTIVFLFKRIDREIERCDKDRKSLWERVLYLERVACPAPNCPLGKPKPFVVGEDSDQGVKGELH